MLCSLLSCDLSPLTFVPRGAAAAPCGSPATSRGEETGKNLNHGCHLCDHPCPFLLIPSIESYTAVAFISHRIKVLSVFIQCTVCLEGCVCTCSSFLLYLCDYF